MMPFLPLVFVFAHAQLFGEGILRSNKTCFLLNETKDRF
jgi:hypothetical protein